MNCQEQTDPFLKGYPRRKMFNRLMMTTLGFFCVLALIPLVSVFAYVVIKGLPAMNWSFFTELPKPVGEVGGGMGNAILGSAVLVLIAGAISIPWGICLGTFLSEYGRGRLGTPIRLSVDILASLPSIVAGLFIYALLVVSMKRFSALAGGCALAILVVPTIARNTEEVLKMVPQHIREGALALGVPRWRVTLSLVLRGTMQAIFTGVMLGLARAAGETAPLLFTAFNNRYWPKGVDQPIASLPVQIYTYAISPFEDWHQRAWAGALVLLLLVCVINLITRFVLWSGRPR